MKKLTMLIIVLGLIVGAFSLVGCTDEPEIIDEVQYVYDEFDHPEESFYEGIEDGSAYISQEIVRVSASEIVISYTNATDDTWVFDEGHLLQYLNRSYLARPGQGSEDFDPDDVWFDKVPRATNWADVALTLKPGESSEVTINLAEYYGALESGIYRIAKEFTRTPSSDGSGSSETMRVTTQFDIE